MTTKNYARSVRAKLLNISKEENVFYQSILTRYFQERLLYRLSVSPYKERFIFMSNRSKESYQEENGRLKQRIKELEKALAFSKLETEARDLMITRAEEYFDIPIRKKSGAK